MNKNKKMQAEAFEVSVAIVLQKSQAELYHRYQVCLANIELSGFTTEEARQIIDNSMRINAEKIEASYDKTGAAKEIRDEAIKAKKKMDDLIERLGIKI